MPVDRSNILFSVMLLSIPSRLEKYLIPLYNRLLKQAGDSIDVELLCMVDNKSMSIGEKRQALLNSARGKWVAFLDDDDDVSDDYISSVREGLKSNPDVLTFDQHATVNGKSFLVNFKMGNPHERLTMDGDTYRNIRRPPYHMCFWKSKLAKFTAFRSVSYGEDIDWCSRMYPYVKSEMHVDKILHYYKYSDETSESIQYKG